MTKIMRKFLCFSQKGTRIGENYCSTLKSITKSYNNGVVIQSEFKVEYIKIQLPAKVLDREFK